MYSARIARSVARTVVVAKVSKTLILSARRSTLIYFRYPLLRRH